MICFLSLLFAAVTSPAEVTITRLDGPPIRGTVVAWSDSSNSSDQIVLQLGSSQDRDIKVKSSELPPGETIEIPTEQILNLRWEGRQDLTNAPDTYIECVDGSRLPLAIQGPLNTTEPTPQVLVTDRLVSFVPAGSEQIITLPTKQIRLIQLLPTVEDTDSLIQEIERQHLVGDVLVVRKRKNEKLDYLAGIVGDLTASHLNFQWENETIPVKRSKVAAFTFYQQHSTQQAIRQIPLPRITPSANTQPKGNSSPTRCRIQTTRGADISISQLTLANNSLQIKTPNGLRLTLPIEELLFTDYSLGKLVYLSDLRPLSAQWSPLIELPAATTTWQSFGKPRNDIPFASRSARSLSHDKQAGVNFRQTPPLTLRWHSTTNNLSDDLKSYDKGLAIRSRTELIYRIPAGMQHFHAIAGIDPATTTQGHVHLRISGDQGDVWENSIDGHQLPQAIELDMKNSTRLTILVDYGKNLDWGDRLHLANARLTR